MTRLQSSAPANYATTVTFPRAYNLQYPGDALTVTATKSGGGASGATGWEVRDLWGDVVATGSWSGTSTTIGTAGSGSFARYDWLTFHLTGPDRGDGSWGADYGTARFVIAETFTGIPTSATRVSGPSSLTDGLNAPYAHGVFSLGGARLALNAQNLYERRQLDYDAAAAATSVTCTMPETSTSASIMFFIHAVVGDDTGAAGPAGWTLDGTGTQGAGATKVSVRIYRKFGSLAGATTVTATTTNAASHSGYLTEMGPYVLNQAPLAIQFFTGTGTSAVITKDMTSLATYEYGVSQVSRQAQEPSRRWWRHRT
jgi:hypothetical protein